MKPGDLDERPICDGCQDELEWGVPHECPVLGTTVLVTEPTPARVRPDDDQGA